METRIPSQPSALAAPSARPSGHLKALTCILALATGLMSGSGAAVGEITRVSESLDGVSRGNSFGGVMSFDGRLVAFTSTNGRLVKGDKNGTDADVFIRDMDTGVVELVSLDNTNRQLFVYYGAALSLSGTGRYIAFSAFPDVDDQAHGQVFVRDRKLRRTLAVPSNGGGLFVPEEMITPEAVAISGNGRVVAFTLQGVLASDGRWISELFIYDRATGVVERITQDVPNTGRSPTRAISGLYLSDDGSHLAFSEYNYYAVDTESSGTFVYDRRSRQRMRVDISSNGVRANSQTHVKAISADGHFVLFASNADNLVDGDTNKQGDVFLHELRTRETTRVNLTSSGAQANGYTDILRSMDLSADARFVAFSSYATNLDPSSPPPYSQIYVRDRETGTTIPTGINSKQVMMSSPDGRFLSFVGYGEQPNFAGRKNAYDVFRLDRSIDRSVSADLSVSQSVSPESFVFGQPVTYTLSAINQGTASAADVHLIDRLPGSARFVSATASQGNCGGETVLVCHLGLLAPGASGTVTLTVEPKWVLTPSLTNAAVVNGAPLDPTLANNRSTLSISARR